MDADRSSWVVHWSGTAIVAVIGIACGGLLVPTGRAEAQQRPPQAQTAQAQQPAAPAGQRPNILVIFGDDVGQTDVSAYSKGVMGYMTPNIDRIAGEGMIFTDYYAEQSCTAGRSSFITGSYVADGFVQS
jgi:arylsulfatase